MDLFAISRFECTPPARLPVNTHETTVFQQVFTSILWSLAIHPSLSLAKQRKHRAGQHDTLPAQKEERFDPTDRDDRLTGNGLKIRNFSAVKKDVCLLTVFSISYIISMLERKFQ